MVTGSSGQVIKDRDMRHFGMLAGSVILSTLLLATVETVINVASLALAYRSDVFAPDGSRIEKPANSGVLNMLSNFCKGNFYRNNMETKLSVTYSWTDRKGFVEQLSSVFALTLAYFAAAFNSISIASRAYGKGEGGGIAIPGVIIAEIFTLYYPFFVFSTDGKPDPRWGFGDGGKKMRMRMERWGQRMSLLGPRRPPPGTAAVPLAGP